MTLYIYVHFLNALKFLSDSTEMEAKKMQYFGRLF